MGKQRQIGWSEKEILLHEIYKKLRRANNVAYKWTQGDFHKSSQTDTYLPIENEGLLYNKKTIKDEYGINIAPLGWRIMNIEDLIDLIEYLGGENIAPGKLKSIELWDEPENTNESGFSALPVGVRESNGKFSGRKKNTFFWIDNR